MARITRPKIAYTRPRTRQACSGTATRAVRARQGKRSALEAAIGSRHLASRRGRAQARGDSAGSGAGVGRGMDYANLGRSGLRVSRLCLGTMNFGGRTDEKESRAIMDRALEAS